VRLTPRSLAAASALLVAALSVTVGVAAGVLPGSWRPYFWLAWPVSLALALASAKVEALRTGAEEPGRTDGTGTGRSRARARLLERVRRSWVTEVLERSLYQEARLELGLQKSTDEPHPWALVSAAPRGLREPVQPGTPLSGLFDELDQAMLVLGGPGSGKTTVMLELLRELLEKARVDRDIPVPVVLPLASWALHQKPQPLADWIVREVAEKHHIEFRHVRAWLEDGQLALLLDGLDEVAAARREECVRAINEFRRAHGTAPLAVSCRTQDYRQFHTALAVYGTLTVQPLSRQQVEEFLDRPDNRFAATQAAIAKQPELWELARTPFMLSIMILAFRVPGSLGSLAGSTRQGLLNRLFEHYVRNMLASRPAADQEPHSAVRRLAFLARQLQRDEQTVFSPDLIDPLSLPGRLWTGVLSTATSLLWTAINVAGMGGIAAAFYGWDGAIAGSAGALLSQSASSLRINSFSLSAETVYGRLQRNTEPPSAVAALVRRLSAAEKSSLIGMVESTVEKELEEGPLKGRFSGEELAFLKEKSSQLHDAKPRRIARVLRDPRISELLRMISGAEMKILVSLAGATLLRELSDGLLKGKLSADELASVKEELSAAAAGIPEAQEPRQERWPELDEGLLRMLHRPRLGWGTRAVQEGIRFMLWRDRLEQRRETWPYVFSRLPLSGVFALVPAGACAGLLLGWFYAPAAMLGGFTALLAVTAAERRVQDRPRRHLGWGFPSPGVRAAIRAGMLAGPLTGLAAGAAAGLLLGFEVSSDAGLQFGVALGACVTLFALSCFGLYALVEQLRIRLVLWWANLLPIGSRAFLDYGVRCSFLRQSGETYLFAHRSLQEFFAAFCPADSNDPDPRLLAILVPGTQLAEEGDASAQYSLGLLLAHQMDPPDLDGARTWWTRAAEGGHTGAQFNLGMLLEDDLNPPDLDGARKWYTRAAEAGDVRAQLNLGFLLSTRLDPPDLDGARTWWTQAAEDGDDRAQFNLGMLFEDDLNPPDLDGARKWYTRAAEAGHDEAAFNLGCLLAEKLEPPDLDGASTWWTKAARAGHSEAAFSLGLLSERRLVPPDLDRALRCYTVAAEAGHTKAQYRLGVLLARPGLLDVKRATFWLTQAAEADDVDAQFFLGRLLELLADPPDPAGARSWYTRAAEADDPHAQFHLAMLLARLDPPELADARAWLIRAARAGHTEAHDALKRLGNS
jgi:TPR repeat protein